MNTLIIEDSHTTAVFLSAIVEKENAASRVAYSGKMAYKFIKEQQFNLVLLDIELPDTNGLEILKKIRQKNELTQLPVIIISAKTEEAFILKSLDLGANDFIAKPFNEIQLRLKIRNLLQVQQSFEQLHQNENKLVKSIEFNKSIINSTRDCFKTLDLNGNLLSMNKGGQELLEIENIEFYLNHSWTKFWKGKDHQQALEAIQKAKKGGTGYFEGYCPTASGKPKWWGIIISPIYGKTGEVEQLLSVSRDITRQKTHEHQLHERIKELNCIQQLSNLVEHHDNIKDILEKLVYVLQESFQYPGDTGIKITYSEYFSQTPNFKSCEPALSVEIHSNNKSAGTIEMGLTPGVELKIPEEEKTLLNLVAQRLGHVAERLEQRKNYEHMFNTLNEAIIKADHKGTITEANQAAASLCGHNKVEDLIGINMKTLYAHPETRDKIVKKLDAEGGVFHNYEFLLKQKNGHTICTLCNIQLLRNSKGDYTGTLGALRDISNYKKIQHDLNESVEKYRRLVNNAIALIMEVNTNTFEIINCNPAMAKSLNKDVKDLIGKNIRNLLPADTIEKLLEIGGKAFRENKVQQYEIERNGRYFLNSVIPHMKENQRLIQIVAYDMTDSKINQTLKESEAKYRELNATKDKFFSIISHDLKNPFSAILGLSELVLQKSRKKEYDKIQKYVEAIHQTSQQAYNLLINLLGWSRLQRGRIDFKPDLLKLNDIVRNTLKLLIASYSKKNIQISVQIPEELNVFADKSMLETIIRNLLSNAIKYTEDNGKIKVSAKAENDETFIEIEDNGIGMKKNDIEKLFKIESSFSTPGTHKEKGTGLGLVLCKEFIEKHGGNIWVESEVNRGTKFSFTLKNKK